MLATARALVTFVQEVIPPLRTQATQERFSNADYMELVAKSEQQHKKFTNDHPKAQTLYTLFWCQAYQEITEHAKNPSFKDEQYWSIRNTSFEEACRLVFQDISSAYKRAREKREQHFDERYEHIGEDVPPHCLVRQCERQNLTKIATIPVGKRDISLFSCPLHLQEACAIATQKAFLDGVQSHFAEKKREPFLFFVGEKPKVKGGAPLIEKFLVAQRLTPDDPIFRSAKMHYGKDIKPLMDGLCDAYVDLAKKYRMAESAIALGMALPELELEQALSYCVRFSPKVWIALDEPLETPRGLIYAFSYGEGNKDNIDFAEKRLGRPLSFWERELAQGYIGTKTTMIGLDAVGDDGLARWTFSFGLSFSDAKRSSFTITDTVSQNWQGCPTGQCRDGEMPCETCMALHTWYFSLYANFIRLLSGEFAETEEVEQKARPVITETVVRNLPRPGKTHKFKEQTIVHRYEVVKMDVLLRKKPLSVQERASISRGSWMEKLNPDAYTHMKVYIEPYKRRYPGKQDQYTIEGHERRVPVKLETYFQRVTYAYAQGKTTDEDERGGRSRQTWQNRRGE